MALVLTRLINSSCELIVESIEDCNGRSGIFFFSSKGLSGVVEFGVWVLFKEEIRSFKRLFGWSFLSGFGVLCCSGGAKKELRSLKMPNLSI